MYVATLRLELRVTDCQAPREKRRRLRAIMDKLRRHFNVSIAEVDGLDQPSEATLGVVAVAGSRREALAVLDRVADALGVHPRLELVRHAIHEV